MAAKRRRSREPGPLLDKPRILLPEPGPFSQYLFYAALLLLGGLGTLGSFFTAFAVPLNAALLLALGTGTALLCAFLALCKKRLLLVSAACAVLWGLSVFLLFDDLIQGCARVVDLVVRAYGDKLNMTLFLMPLDPAGPKQTAYECTVFAGLLLFPFFWFLSWLFIRRRSALGAFCFTGLFLLLPMAISLLPEGWAMALLLLFWVVLLLTAPTLGQRHKLLDERGRFHASGISAARPATLLLVPLAALCMALVYAVFPFDTYERPQIANDIRAGLTDGFGLAALFQGGVGNGNSTVNLDSLGDRKYSGKTVLRVKYDWDAPTGSSPSQKEYLKSFVGSVYTGRSWERLPAESGSQLEELLGEEKIQNMPSRLNQLMPSSQVDHSASYHLEVENVGGNPRCIYAPYGLSTPPAGIASLEMAYVDDGFLKSSNWLAGVKQYELDGRSVSQDVTAAEFAVPYFLRFYRFYATQAFVEYQAQYYRPLLTEDDLEQGVFSIDDMWMELESRLSEDLTRLMEEYGGNPTAGQLERWTIPDWAAEPLDPETLAFARAIEAYNAYVYDTYTQLPEGLAEFLRSYLNVNVLDLSNPQDLDSYYTYYTRLINTLFTTKFSYTLSPPAVPPGEDFVKYFLSESRQGYCVHFATAAVALLRAAGIPARYAEGYAVSSWKNGEWQDVPDYNAHAWVEVYAGGSGWLPVEVTPSSPDAPGSYYNATAPSATPVPTASPSPEPSSLPESSASSSASSALSSQPESGVSSAVSGGPGGASSASGGGPGLPVLLGSLGAIALLLAALWGNRRLHLRARRKEFSQRDRNRAALCAYRHLLRLRAWSAQLPSAAHADARHAPAADPGAPSADAPFAPAADPGAPSADAPSGSAADPGAPSADAPFGPAADPGVPSADAPSGSAADPGAPSADAPSGPAADPGTPSTDAPFGPAAAPGPDTPDAPLPGVFADVPSALEDLAAKARFSQHILTSGELGLFLDAVRKEERLLKRELPLLSRLRCEYLLGLF